MKKLKTLTVNGERYQITDPTAARMEEVADRLCPPLRESGAAVRCAPVKDHPLQVVSHLPQSGAQTLTLHHCGKNILDISTAGVYHRNAVTPYTDMYVTDSGIHLEAIRDSTSNWDRFGFCLGTVKELAGKTITLSARVETTSSTATTHPNGFIVCTEVEPTTVREKPRYGDGGYWGSTGSVKDLKSSGKNNGSIAISYTVTGDEPKPYIAVALQFSYGETTPAGDWTRWSDLQVEIGDRATGYEPYRGQTYTAQPGAADSYDWSGENICGLEGVNTLWCDAGTVTVTGRADPVTEMEKLTNAILALGGNL